QRRPEGRSAAGQDHVVSGEFCDASGSDGLVVMSTAAQADPAAPAGSAGPLAHRRPLGDRVFQILAAAAGVLVLVILALIAISTSQQASSWLSTAGWSIFTVDWNPATSNFGAMRFVYGTGVTAAIAIILSVPVGVVSALPLRGVGRTMGETIAAAMVMGSSPVITSHLFAAGYDMPAVIASQFGEASGEFRAALIGLGVMLFVITIVINLIARGVVERSARRK